MDWSGNGRVQGQWVGKDLNGNKWTGLGILTSGSCQRGRFPINARGTDIKCPESAQSISPKEYKIGLRSRDLQRDVMWIACVLRQKRKYKFFEIPGRMRAVYALAGFFNPKRKSDLLCLDDPMPALAQLPGIVKKLAVKSQLK